MKDKDKSKSYKGLHFSDELLKEKGSPKACYEHVRNEELKKISRGFYEWYDNYIEINLNAPNCTIPIFFCPFPQNMNQSEDYFYWIKKKVFHELDKILLFINALRFWLLSPKVGKTENCSENTKYILDLIWNQFDLYSRAQAKMLLKEKKKIARKEKRICKEKVNKDDEILKKMFGES